jgi:uncharacterized protein
MTRDRIEHHILWHCSLLSSSEHTVLTESQDGYRLQGVAVLPVGELPGHIEYAVAVDRQWRPSQARAAITTPSGIREIILRSQHGAGWEVDTVPIRRLGLEVGQTVTITAAWVRFPELDVVASEQRYRRLATDRWQYASGRYDYQLVVDPDTGFALSYGDDLWRAAATVFR